MPAAVLESRGDSMRIRSWRLEFTCNCTIIALAWSAVTSSTRSLGGKIMPEKEVPVWLITGCSTGFGRELASSVLAHGRRAVVTARDRNKVQDLVAGHEGQALALDLDVNNAEPGCGSRGDCRVGLRADRRAREQRRLRIPGSGRGKRRGRSPVDVRDQLLRTGADDQRRSTGDAGAPERAYREHLLDGRHWSPFQAWATTTPPSLPSRVSPRRWLRRSLSLASRS